MSKMNAKQTEALKTLSTGGDVDGRTLRALKLRGYATEGGKISAKGKQALEA